MGETSMNGINQSINQSILDIDFHRTSENESVSLTFRRFGISKYNKQIHYLYLLSNVTHRGLKNPHS